MNLPARIAFVVVIFCGLTSLIVAQTKSVADEDVTQAIRRIYKIGIGRDKMVYGASLSENGLLDITFVFDEMIISIWTGYGITEKGARRALALDLTFSYARNVAKRYPGVQRIRLFFAKPLARRDQYGNIVEVEKHIQCSTEITPATIRKINWTFVKDELDNIELLGGDPTVLLKMLDTYYFNPEDF